VGILRLFKSASKLAELLDFNNSFHWDACDDFLQSRLTCKATNSWKACFKFSLIFALFLKQILTSFEEL
jgi:hypothetical protein